MQTVEINIEMKHKNEKSEVENPLASSASNHERLIAAKSRDSMN